MRRVKVLIVEDNPDILANLYVFFEPLGYILDSARDGLSGLSRAAAGDYDVIVLDVMLPGLNGIDVCKRLRQEALCSTPILMLTARDTVNDKILGFESGADDYLVKPFSMAELDARIKALIRRNRGALTEAVLCVGPLTFDTGTYTVTRERQRLELTPTGYVLLRSLMVAAPNVVSRESLEREIWQDNPPDSESLRTHVHALRAALDKPFKQPMLITVHGIGYR